MSFILDALKKSENERQKSSGAEFAAVPINPGSPSFPRWLLLLGLLLAVNLIVLLGLLLRQEAKPAAGPNRQAETQTPSTQAVAVASADQQTAPPSFEQQVAAARAKPPARQPAATDNEVVNNREPDLQAVLISQNPSSVTPQQLYPTLQEMRATGTLDLPDLHLDIHVFSETSADRFVFINMAKLREGSRLDEGPTLTEITPDGVVLRYQGKSFLVPRE